MVHCGVPTFLRFGARDLVRLGSAFGACPGTREGKSRFTINPITHEPPFAIDSSSCPQYLGSKHLGRPPRSLPVCGGSAVLRNASTWIVIRQYLGACGRAPESRQYLRGNMILVGLSVVLPGLRVVSRGLLASAGLLLGLWAVSERLRLGLSGSSRCR